MLSTLTATAPHWGPYAGFAPWPFFLIGPVVWLLVIGLIVFLVARRRRYWAMNGFGPGWHQSRSAEQTLAERFAQGDVDEVEYRARLEVLRANRPGPAR